MDLPDDTTIIVCARCLCASCWLGYFMCDGSRGSNTTRTVAELRKLNREHPGYWAERIGVGPEPENTR